MRNYKHILIVIGCPANRNGKPSQGMISLARKTVQLYKKDNYSAVMLSGGSGRYGVPSAAVLRVMMLNYIPHERIIVETRSKTLVQNALFCYALLKNKEVKSVTMLCMKHKKARAEHVFRKLYNHMNVNIRFETADEDRDIVEKIGLFVKERSLLAYHKIFGLR